MSMRTQALGLTLENALQPRKHLTHERL